MISTLPEAIYAAAYCTVALLMLTWVGNLTCRWLLKATRLTEAMEAKQAAAQARAQVAASPAPASPPAQQPPPTSPSRSEPQVGAVIGAFERSLLAIGVLAGSWEVVAAVVALKTVARFKELDERLDAEYFLVGSLFSLVWAIGITLAWVAYDTTRGLDLSSALIHTLTAFKGD